MLAQRNEVAQESGPCNQSLWLESDEMSWEERGQTSESVMASWQVLQMSFECCFVHWGCIHRKQAWCLSLQGLRYQPGEFSCQPQGIPRRV